MLLLASAYFFWTNGWQTYQSPRGYKLQFPRGWRVDSRSAQKPYERIVSPDEAVVLAVSVYEDKNASTEKGFTALVEEIRQSYQQNSGFTLISFDPKYHPDEYIVGDYVAAAIRSDSGQTFEQTEMGLVTRGGYIYIVTANVEIQLGQKYEKVIEKIFLNFEPILK